MKHDLTSIEIMLIILSFACALYAITLSYKIDARAEEIKEKLNTLSFETQIQQLPKYPEFRSLKGPIEI